MGVNTSVPVLCQHPYEGYAFPEISENDGFFPPQPAKDMVASRNLGPLPEGVQLSDLPFWRIQGSNVLIIYLYSLRNDGVVIRSYAVCRYVDGDSIRNDDDARAMVGLILHGFLRQRLS